MSGRRLGPGSFEFGLALLFYAAGSVMKSPPPELVMPVFLLATLLVAYPVVQPLLKMDLSTWGLVALVIMVLGFGATKGIEVVPII